MLCGLAGVIAALALTQPALGQSDEPTLQALEEEGDGFSPPGSGPEAEDEDDFLPLDSVLDAEDEEDFSPPEPGKAQVKGKAQAQCDHLPDPRGRAVGIRRRCPELGSSSGIAKGDFNGDGFGDLAIGVPFEDLSGQSNAGAVNVIYGAKTGLVAPSTGGTIPLAQIWHQDSKGIPGVAERNDRFGSALAAGDFNRDGFSDLAVGVPGEAFSGTPETGAVNVIYGSANGLTATDSGVPAAQLWNFGDEGAGLAPGFPGMLGATLAWGDYDGDKVGDLAIGMPRFDFAFLEDTIIDAGAVWVVFGQAGKGLSTAGQEFLDDSDAGSTLVDRDLFAASVAGGDFDGDGVTDLAVGVPFEEVEVCVGRSCLTRDNAGAVDLFFGSSRGLSPSNSGRVPKRLTQASADSERAVEANDLFGLALAAGRFDGDGRDDLAVGTPNESLNGVCGINTLSLAGIVHVFYGGGGIKFDPAFFQSQLFGCAADSSSGSPSEPFDRFGSALTAGDFDGNGIKDLAVGVPFEDVGSISNAGVVDVIYGAASGLQSTDAESWHQNTAGVLGGAEREDRFGAPLTAWDFGGGTRADLAIGVQFEDLGSISNAGAVNVLYGASGGLTSSGDQFWTQNSSNVPGGAESGDRFGAALY
jgi:hypothetical protein